MDIDAVVFDLYGTLLEVSSVGRTAAKVTSDPAPFVDLWRTKQLEYTWLRSLMGRYQNFWATTGDALDYTLDGFGIVVDDDVRAELLHAWIDVRPYPEVPDALGALAPRTLAVLSNGNPDMLHAGIAAAGLTDVFAHVFSVDEVADLQALPSCLRAGRQSPRGADRTDPVRILQRLGRRRRPGFRLPGGLDQPHRRAVGTARRPAVPGGD